MRDKVESNLRYDYDLNEESIVFDLGGYEGQWTSDIFGRYRCTVFVFEPVRHLFNSIKTRFRHNASVKCFPFGLAERDYSTTINIDQNRSSIYISTGGGQEIHLQRASKFFEENGISHIDLLKINIEGAEYDLLDHLIATRLIQCISNIQVQFHEFVPNASERMKDIQSELQKTHRLTYQYIFVWENWTLR